MRTKSLKKIFLLTVLLQCLASTAMATSTVFSLEWDYSNLPIHVHMYLLPKGNGLRDSQTGVLTDKIKALMTNEITDSKVRMWSHQQKDILLVIDNLADHALNFSVAPHHTAPVDESMNFKFFCLCNGHVYHIPAKGRWYRQMKLKADDTLSAKDVTLRHVIYEAKKK